MTTRSRRRNTSRAHFKTDKQEAVASKGMVASNHPLASAAGVEMLAMGGNAMDAAVATAFALTVVEPMMISIFGAGFINFYNASTGEIITLDNYSVAPKAATPDVYETVSDTWPDYLETVDRKNKIGYLAVGVPGSLQAWCQMEESYGRLGLDTVVQPAIRYAERGSSASQLLVDKISEVGEDLNRFPASREVFLPGGAPPNPGHLIVRSDYARTLKMVAREGYKVLHSGELGERVLRDMAANGGIMTADDLAGYSTKQRDPVRGTYRGYEIVSVGPTSSGGVCMIQALNIVEEFDVAAMGFGSADYIHLVAESLRIAFADRFEHLTDPDSATLPVEGLVSKGYAALRRREIDMERSQDYGAGQPWAYAGESRNTTHLTVADDQGNIVSTTQTLNGSFGSKVTVPGTGMLLNDTMALFDPHPGHANSIAPGKRMLSSMAPTIVMKKGKPFMGLGTPGGTRIFAAVLQAIVNVIDHGMTLQEAVEAPRVWTQGQQLEVEYGFSPSVLEELRAMGHEVEEMVNVAGGMNGIMYDEGTGLIHGAACWRRDGAPIGISGGPARPARRGVEY